MNYIIFSGFDDEESLKEYLMLETPEVLYTMGGIVFENDFPDDNTLPDNVDYKIRSDTSVTIQLD